ncbi:protein phosphatase 2C domain-containing protein (plasmid) [Pseudomonas fulva]|uniref:Protein phosphatase 2C domain-containing protein n=1 Tax=Pseudomonas putida TaxID=303 RepID=A0ABD7BLK0_PSEPU|nr:MULTISPECIES: PP2C family serine/threonine-protein phosphatase [Pseudomonas putida group]QOD01626.1 protein phosphatase 2C domain-containing protein [Pseudomonas putida]QPH46898.1 protein phosphatase 2C domain-containing protein [Pseudomonas fulva]
MLWECASAAVIGTAHSERGGVCQDRCSSQVFDQAGTPWAAIFVADGAGSAQYSELGAELAINTANESVTQLMHLAEVALDESLAVEIVSNIRQAISHMAKERGLPTRSFACTFLGALTSPTGTIVFQIGDGGIVLDPGHGIELALEPKNGEYANMTHFCTDSDALVQLQTRIYPAGVKAIAAFSDGLQRLALDMAKGEPHLPFFEPIFRKVATLNGATRPQIIGALESFLGSDRVNERTDDDKSLAIAVLRV